MAGCCGKKTGGTKSGKVVSKPYSVSKSSARTVNPFGAPKIKFGTRSR